MKIALKVMPGAKRNELLGWEENYPGVGRVLKMKVAAPPAKLLHVPKSSVSIVQGSAAHIKRVQLPDDIELSQLG